MRDGRFDAIDRGSDHYEIVITDGSIDPGSGEGPRAVEAALADLDPKWAQHVQMP